MEGEAILTQHLHLDRDAGREAGARGRHVAARGTVTIARGQASLRGDHGLAGHGVAFDDGVARHTAEGDAITADRILVALLPALVARGVRTVADGLRLPRGGTRPF